MKKIFWFILAGVAVILVVWFSRLMSVRQPGEDVGSQGPPRIGLADTSVTPPVGTPGSERPSSAAGRALQAFGTPTKAAHFEGSAPAHGETLAAPPTNVVIDFNFDLAPGSSIAVLQGGKDYGAGAASIDSNKLALRRAVDPAAPDGVYTVQYRACWPDRSCDDGQFQFAIDRTLASAATDLRGQAAVSVRLKDIAFTPQNLRISKGTRVTWVNDDAVEHYVNTDAHPGHTYYPAQNSKVLKTGETFSLAFNDVGAYPYHCSAHADSMRGTVLVE